MARCRLLLILLSTYVACVPAEEDDCEVHEMKSSSLMQTVQLDSMAEEKDETAKSKISSRTQATIDALTGATTFSNTSPAILNKMVDELRRHRGSIHPTTEDKSTPIVTDNSTDKDIVTITTITEDKSTPIVTENSTDEDINELTNCHAAIDEMLQILVDDKNLFQTEINGAVAKFPVCKAMLEYDEPATAEVERTMPLVQPAFVTMKNLETGSIEFDFDLPDPYNAVSVSYNEQKAAYDAAKQEWLDAKKNYQDAQKTKVVADDRAKAEKKTCYCDAKKAYHREADVAFKAELETHYVRFSKGKCVLNGISSSSSSSSSTLLSTCDSMTIVTDDVKIDYKETETEIPFTFEECKTEAEMEILPVSGDPGVGVSVP